MTQAPATPELVDDWALEIAACGFANDSTLPDSVRSFIKDLWRAYCEIEQQAADALEAQQARIAELEAVLTLARDFAETEVEMRGAAGSDMSDYQNEAQEVVDAIDQALSSQGRHEGATSDGSVA